LDRSVLQVKRPGPEIDDSVVTLQDLGAEQARHWLRTSKQIAMDETFEINHPHVFAKDIYRAHRYLPDPGYRHATLL
jgi:hypothetical protein